MRLVAKATEHVRSHPAYIAAREKQNIVEKNKSFVKDELWRRLHFSDIFILEF